jgi:integrase
MRWGELAGLQRRHVGLVSGVIKIRQVVVELPSGELRISPPKTNAGRRTVYLPEVVLHDLRIHFESERDAFVFTGAKGARSCAGQPFKGCKGLAVAGLTGPIHFRDLRHTGNSWAAEAGATLRELMDRMVHASACAGLNYIHSATATGASPRPCQN